MPLLIIFLSSLILSLPIALLSPGTFFRGWSSAAILLFFALLGLWASWRWGGGGRKLAVLISLAFILRLGGGIALSQAYMAWGYDKEVYHLGYLFPDAMERDMEAYQVGVSEVPLLFNPALHLGSDQYGGLGLISAAVYRLLSPDSHRPYLILILASACFALGVPFLHKAASLGWGPRTAALAAWIYVIYPDGIFFTASQMREPFIIGLSAVILWAALAWRSNLRAAILAGVMAIFAILFISPPAAAFIAIVMALRVWIDLTAEHQGSAWKLLGLAGISFGALILLAVTWNFFREAAGWDVTLSETGSGMLANVIGQIGSQLRIPFITLYGLAQPVLPAAIFEPSIPLAKTILLTRSIGWYSMLPLLIYAGIAVKYAPSGIERLRAIWLASLPWLWLIISSIRAGGDMSDNPRYRLILLVLLSISAAAAYIQAREQKDPWFSRILIIEGLFLLFFAQWYAARYIHFLVKLPFVTMLALIIGSSSLVIGGGLLYDGWKKRQLVGK